MVPIRKGARVLAVDGVVYRWRVRKRSTYPQARAQTPLSFAVERADRGGAVLIVTLPARPGSWVGAGAASVVPSLVVTAIRRGRERGWTGERPGPAVRLTLDDEVSAAGSFFTPRS